jgi:hypothetical protein
VNSGIPIVFETFGSKNGKTGLRRYANALREVRAAYQCLDPAIRPWFSLLEFPSVVGQPTHIDREIEKAEASLNRSKPPSRAIRHKRALMTYLNGGITNPPLPAVGSGQVLLGF